MEPIFNIKLEIPPKLTARIGHFGQKLRSTSKLAEMIAHGNEFKLADYTFHWGYCEAWSSAFDSTVTDYALECHSTTSRRYILEFRLAPFRWLFLIKLILLIILINSNYRLGPCLTYETNVCEPRGKAFSSFS